MDSKLDEQLCKDFPLVFRDRHASVRNSCMAFGFSCDDGWEPIIREAAAKLEPLIQKYMDETPVKCVCGCVLDTHVHGKCSTIHKMPYGWASMWTSYIVKDKWTPKIMWKRLKQWVLKKIDYASYFLFNKLHIHKKKRCWCNEFKHSHPCASQIKEKYAGLRFYFTSGTDEMFDITDTAENKSKTVCEVCGKDGFLCTTGHWLKTMCQGCLDKASTFTKVV